MAFFLILDRNQKCYWGKFYIKENKEIKPRPDSEHAALAPVLSREFSSWLKWKWTFLTWLATIAKWTESATNFPNFLNCDIAPFKTENYFDINILHIHNQHKNQAPPPPLVCPAVSDIFFQKLLFHKPRFVLMFQKRKMMIKSKCPKVSYFVLSINHTASLHWMKPCRHIWLAHPWYFRNKSNLWFVVSDWVPVNSCALSYRRTHCLLSISHFVTASLLCLPELIDLKPRDSTIYLLDN